ncbi:hypothetical protein T265_01324 [Opisthorchis viverrini]|uniref:Uncharacterized protein n=1 Tax=Opisthorchis viverrini TaxID=6198 RepID=A0A075A325_OPIVI|nr:hypothetical protein T265_01324 [Opisthorchis viverrini]KER32637.1 hypothetical protein T265_01324 [Opisthorchis viverrini]
MYHWTRNPEPQIVGPAALAIHYYWTTVLKIHKDEEMLDSRNSKAPCQRVAKLRVECAKEAVSNHVPHCRSERKNPSPDQGVPIRQIIPGENRFDLLSSSAGLNWSSSRFRLGTTPVSDLRQRPPRCSCESMSTFCGRLEILEFQCQCPPNGCRRCQAVIVGLAPSPE